MISQADLVHISSSLVDLTFFFGIEFTFLHIFFGKRQGAPIYSSISLVVSLIIESVTRTLVHCFSSFPTLASRLGESGV
jgi:hypothetical protein